MSTTTYIVRSGLMPGETWTTLDAARRRAVELAAQLRCPVTVVAQTEEVAETVPRPSDLTVVARDVQMLASIPKDNCLCYVTSGAPRNALLKRVQRVLNAAIAWDQSYRGPTLDDGKVRIALSDAVNDR